MAGMKFNLYRDIKPFYRDCYYVLMRNEAQNLIPLGNIIIGNEGKDKTGWRNPANWFMATVADDTGILLTAVMTPPHRLTLYATDNCTNENILNYFIDGIGKLSILING